MQSPSELVADLRRRTIDDVLGRNRPAPAAYVPAPVPLAPVGRSLRWSEDQIAALALPTVADLERARARVEQTQERDLLLLLLALLSQDAARSMAYVFDYEAFRYFLIDRARQMIFIIPPERITQLIDEFLEKARMIPLQLMAALLKQDLPIGLWQSLMRDEVVALHLVSAAAVAGGFSQVLSFDYPQMLQPLVTYHLTALDRFSRQLESGALDINGDLFARSELYANAARLTRFDFERDVQRGRGVELARRVRTILESCAGCVREAGGLLTGGGVQTVNDGFIPIRHVKALGGEECKMNCLCLIQYFGGLPSAQMLGEIRERIRQAAGLQ